MKIQYQFATDGPCFINERPLDYACVEYPAHDTWEDAAADAVKAGYAKWDSAVLVLDVERGARIKSFRVEDKQ